MEKESQMNVELLGSCKNMPLIDLVELYSDDELEAISEDFRPQINTGAGDYVPNPPEYSYQKPAMSLKPKYSKLIRKSRVDQQLSLSFKKMKSQIDLMNEMIRSQDVKSNLILETLKATKKIPECKKVDDDTGCKKKIEDPQLNPAFFIWISITFLVTILIIFCCEDEEQEPIITHEEKPKSTWEQVWEVISGV
jgi:hypothetical protein